MLISTTYSMRIGRKDLSKRRYVSKMNRSLKKTIVTFTTIIIGLLIIVIGLLILLIGLRQRDASRQLAGKEDQALTETIVIENTEDKDAIYSHVQEDPNEKLLLQFAEDTDFSRLDEGTVLDISYSVLEETNPALVQVEDYSYIESVVLEDIIDGVAYASLKDLPNTKLILSFDDGIDISQLSEGMDLNISYRILEETNPLNVEVQSFSVE